MVSFFYWKNIQFKKSYYFCAKYAVITGPLKQRNIIKQHIIN